jgi:hypothetical protein
LNRWKRENIDIRPDLSDVILLGTILSKADLNDAYFSGAEFEYCTMRNTIVVDVDFSKVKRLVTVEHYGLSIIGTDAIYKSGGKIPRISFATLWFIRQIYAAGPTGLMAMARTVSESSAQVSKRRPLESQRSQHLPPFMLVTFWRRKRLSDTERRPCCFSGCSLWTRWATTAI